MLENGFITEEQHDAAREQTLRYRPPTDVPVHAEYVAEAARQLVFSQYGDEAYTRGLNVYLTLDSDEQLVAYRALRKGIMDYERRQVYRGPEAYVDLPADPAGGRRRIAEALPEHPDNDELRAGVALEAAPKKVRRGAAERRAVTVTGDGLKPAASGLAEQGQAEDADPPRRGDPRSSRAPRATGRITQLPEVEGAFVALDPRTARSARWSAASTTRKSKFNHVTQAWRQPGSSFKPFIYSAALEKGFTPATVINDAPLFFDAGATGSQPWEPKNYDGKFEGPMTMRRALAKSKNMVSIRILQSIGPAYAQDWVTRFGFDADKHPAYLTMALGAGSVTPLQMAAAYARVRQRRLPRESVADRARSPTPRAGCSSEAQPRGARRVARTIDARNAFMMTSLLQEVTRSGTAARPRRTLKRPDVYGKTGTTNDSMDAWFAGLQPQRRGGGLDGLRHSRASWATARPAAAWRCRSGSTTWATRSRRAGRSEPTRARRRGQRRRRVVLRGVHAAAPASAAWASTTSCQPRRPRKSARASSTCSSAERSATSLGAASGRREAQRPAGLLAGAGRQRVEELAARRACRATGRRRACSGSRRPRRQPQLLQRRLRVQDELAAAGKAQLEQAAGALACRCRPRRPAASDRPSASMLASNALVRRAVLGSSDSGGWHGFMVMAR